MRKLIAIALLCAAPAFATAFGAATAWDVRTTGSDTNGGGFDSSVVSPGTDQSQGSATAFTNLVCATTTCTSVTLSFSSTSPGNFVYVTGGTGCNTGPFEILSQSSGTATFNASLGTGTCSGNAYGSLATVCSAYSSGHCTAGAYAYAVTGNTVWVKNGTNTTSIGYTNTNAATNTFSVTVEGYGSTHGDFGTRPVFTTSTGSLNIFSASAPLTLINIIISNTTSGTPFSCIGDSAGGAITLNLYLVKCDMTGTTGGAGIFQQGNQHGFVWGTIQSSEFACNSTGEGIEDLGNSSNLARLIVKWSYFHGCAAAIWDGNSGSNIAWSIQNSTFSGNGRDLYQQTSDGISVELVGNNFYNSTNQHVYINASGIAYMLATNNIFYGGTYGIFTSSTPVLAVSQTNAYGNLSTANYSGWIAGINSSDIALSASPFTNPSSANFALNSTSGGGAALKAAGFPGVSPFGTGYLDVGALQSQAATGGGAGFWIQ